jgi:hypothetical protein
MLYLLFISEFYKKKTIKAEQQARKPQAKTENHGKKKKRRKTKTHMDGKTENQNTHGREGKKMKYQNRKYSLMENRIKM